MGNSTEQNNLPKGMEQKSEKIYFTARCNWNCYYGWFPMLSMFLVAYVFAARSHSSIRDKLNLPFIIFIWENVLIKETHFDKRIYLCKNLFQLCKNPCTYHTCQRSLFIPKIARADPRGARGAVPPPLHFGTQNCEKTPIWLFWF